MIQETTQLTPRRVTLRDGRQTTVWVDPRTGHGTLDKACWEKAAFYEADYREEFGPELAQATPPDERLRIYSDLNDKQFDVIAPLLSPTTRFLEIGAAAGGILERAVQCGVAVAHGVEPNLMDAAFVSGRLPTAHVAQAPFLQADLANGVYDVVVSLEVLEHVPDPRAFLQRCHEVLRPGGALHIEVPNFNDVLLGTYENDAYADFFFHKAHIHYFTPTSLAELCADSGFEGTVSSFLMYPLFNHVWWHQNGGPQGSATTAMTAPQPGNDTIAGEAINAFYQRAQSEYEELVNEHMVGDCLIFQGQKA